MSNSNEKKDDGTASSSVQQPYIVTPEGSLALLALGYKGLELWRKKRAEADTNTKSSGRA